MPKLLALTEVEKIANTKPDPTVRLARRLDIGQAIHQGDVYVHRVKDDHPRGEPLGTRQVAVGTTVGARHFAEGPLTVYAGKQLPEWVTPGEDYETADYLGPVVVASEEWVLTHPEHAHHQLPKGTYQVTYQINETTKKRVVD